MKIESIDVTATIERTRQRIDEEKGLSPSLRTTLEMLLLLVKILMDRLNLNSSNSSKPPSSDPNRERKKNPPGARKPGGQPGRKGVTLELDDNPDVVHDLTVDRGQLPTGEYQDVGVERRQVFDIDIRRVITEYRAQILEDADGRRFTAAFPSGVNSPVQYGPTLKGHAVYLSQYQLLPYKRINEYFSDQMGIPVSEGSLFNFNQEAYKRLEFYDSVAQKMLLKCRLLQVDETSLNLCGDKVWLHVLSSVEWVYFHVHEKRGLEAMKALNVLPRYCGILMHDHWKPYFSLPDTVLHALCNSHHDRELTRAWEQDNQNWAKEMQELLLELNKEVKDAGGRLSEKEGEKWRQRYKNIIEKGEIECPPPDPEKHQGKRGRQKRSKARNLLERLRDFEQETLRFMEVDDVPFTNNRAENDIRMTKVQQKISGCFRSIEGARIFCRVRGYLLTCQRRNISASQALTLLFNGSLPDFVKEG